MKDMKGNEALYGAYEWLYLLNMVAPDQKQTYSEPFYTNVLEAVRKGLPDSETDGWEY